MDCRVKPSYPRLNPNHPFARALAWCYSMGYPGVLRDLGPGRLDTTVTGGAGITTPADPWGGGRQYAASSYDTVPGTADFSRPFTLAAAATQKPTDDGARTILGQTVAARYALAQTNLATGIRTEVDGTLRTIGRPTPGTPFTAVVSWDGGTVRAWVNGVRGVNASSAGGSASGSVVVGESPWSTFRNWTGQISLVLLTFEAFMDDATAGQFHHDPFALVRPEPPL